MKTLSKYFFEGILIVAPTFGAFYIVMAIISKIDSIVDIGIPGAGILITITGLTIVGFLAKMFLTKWIFMLFEKILNKLPLVSLLYGSIKDLIGAFVGENKAFDKPVAVVTDEPSGQMALGFITNSDLSDFDLKEHVAVYFPQSYNFAGSVFVYPKEKIKPLNVDSSKLMTFVVSGGVSSDKA